MKVSIIIPVYNAGRYLTKCLDSVLNQTYKNLEIIIINDGSTDNSVKIINEYQRIYKNIIFVDKVNEGVSEARNIGIEKATGNYVMFVDSDDWLENDMVEKLCNESNDGKVDIVRCGYIRDYVNFSEKNSICITKIKMKKNKKIIYDMFINSYNLNSPCCQIIKKDCIQKLFNKKIKVGEDYLFNLDVYTNAKSIILLPDCYYHYLYNDNSATTIISYDKIYKRCEDAITVYSHLLDYIKIWNLDDSYKEKVAYRILKELNIKLIALFKSSGNNKEKKKILFEFMNNIKVKKISKNLKIKTILKNFNIYSLFILLIKFRLYNLYFIFASTIYKTVYNIKK